MFRKKIKLSYWRTRDGKTRTIKLYRTWANMKQRCLNKNDKSYEYYGGRGIEICPEWLEYEGFHSWAVSSGFGKGLTIERRDNDGNYCPENCCWVTQKDQQKNTRKTVHITFNGETKHLREWARCLGISHQTLLWRLDNWTKEKAMTHSKCW